MSSLGWVVAAASSGLAAMAEPKMGSQTEYTLMENNDDDGSVLAAEFKINSDLGDLGDQVSEGCDLPQPPCSTRPRCPPPSLEI